MNQHASRRGVELPLQVLPGAGLFTGYASLFGKRDQQGDIVLPGAFTGCLKQRGAEGVRMLFQHNPSEPVGTWIELRETPRGLYVRGRLNRDVQRGRELIALLEGGGLDGLSIGFRTLRARHDRISKARQLLDVDLWEISLVTFPMLEGARVSTVKSAARARADGLFNLPPVTEKQIQTIL